VVSTIKRLLDHLGEAAFCTKSDIKGIQRQLEGFQTTLNSQKDRWDEHIVKHLESRITGCQPPLERLLKILGRVPDDLTPTYERLVSILRSLCACNVRSKFPTSEVIELSKELNRIREKLGEPEPIDDKAMVECYTMKLQELMATEQTDGRSLVTDLLARTILWARLMQKRPAYVSDGFQSTFKKLNVARNTLESKFLVQTWSIRETDLYIYQRQLDKIDNSRNTAGDFVDGEGRPADLQTQRVCSSAHCTHI
jgi:hypothetical protein